MYKAERAILTAEQEDFQNETNFMVSAQILLSKKRNTTSKGAAPSWYQVRRALGPSKGAGSFHIHRKTMKELGALAVLGIRERPNLAQNLVTHRH